MLFYRSYTDEDLIKAIQNDDEAAFTSLYNRYWEQLYNAAYKRLKNHETCEQIVQDIFTDLWLRRKQTIISNAPGYLHTAVQYQVYKAVTRQKTGTAFFELFEQLGTSSYQADSDIKYKEFSDLIEDWMNTLPIKRREIFKLHYFENLNSLQIAEQLQVSPKTVRNQLGTSLESFRIRLSRFLSLML